MIALIAAASFLATPLTGLNADPHLGAATAANMAAMIIPPTPHGATLEGGDGTLAVTAIRRLYADKVKVPARTSTASVGRTSE